MDSDELEENFEIYGVNLSEKDDLKKCTFIGYNHFHLNVGQLIQW